MANYVALQQPDSYLFVVVSAIPCCKCSHHFFSSVFSVVRGDNTQAFAAVPGESEITRWGGKGSSEGERWRPVI